MKKLCRNCEYFKYPNVDMPNYGSCTHVKIVEGGSAMKREPIPLIIYAAYEDYCAYLHIHRDFGCVLFRQKNK